MVNVWNIARKELKVYYVSPLFWVLSALFVLIFGAFFDLNMIQSLTAPMSTAFNIALFTLFFIAPLITMRLFAQEKQQGTIELLLTMPVRDWEVVIGKFLAAWVMFASMVAFTLVSVLILLWTEVDRTQILFLKVGNLDWGPVLVGYLGFLLVGGGYLAIGLLASSFTQNQILAAFIGIVAGLMVLVAGTLGSSALFPQRVSDFLSFLGSQTHVDAFGRGVFTVPDLFYCLTLIGVPLYLAVVVLGSRKWH